MFKLAMQFFLYKSALRKSTGKDPKESIVQYINMKLQFKNELFCIVRYLKFSQNKKRKIYKCIMRR